MTANFLWPQSPLEPHFGTSQLTHYRHVPLGMQIQTTAQVQTGSVTCALACAHCSNWRADLLSFPVLPSTKLIDLSSFMPSTGVNRTVEEQRSWAQTCSWGYDVRAEVKMSFRMVTYLGFNETWRALGTLNNLTTQEKKLSSCQCITYL